jgi:hypothetical protein
MSVCLEDHQNAISCWLESIAVSPGNADVHVNIANAYILTNPPRGHLAEKHLREAFKLSPLDPEIVRLSCFHHSYCCHLFLKLTTNLSYRSQVYNLAAVLEASQSSSSPTTRLRLPSYTALIHHLPLPVPQMANSLRV